MIKHSYRIKHDFLFDSDDTLITIPHLNSSVNDFFELKLSYVLKSKNEKTFMEGIDVTSSNILINDDIGQCTNPASERYKQFIIRCVYRKLSSYSLNVYLK